MDINDFRPLTYKDAHEYLTEAIANTPAGQDICLPERVAVVLAAGDVAAAVYPPLHRGDNVIMYDGMGEYSLGVLLKDSSSGDGSERLPVLLNGYIDPDGLRHEPYEVDYSRQSINFDPDPVASLKDDQARMIAGYSVILAKL